MAHSVFSELTVSSLPWPNMPGPATTGHRIGEASLLSPSGQPWWDPSGVDGLSGTILSSTPSGTVIQGFKFQRVYLADGVSGITFRDCLFDGDFYHDKYWPDTTQFPLFEAQCAVSKVHPNMVLDYCTLKNGMSISNNLLKSVRWKTISNCEISDLMQGVSRNFHYETSAVIKDNWFHRLGGSIVHDFAILNIKRNWGSAAARTQGVGFIFSGNYVDTGCHSLVSSIDYAGSATNPYALQWDNCCQTVYNGPYGVPSVISIISHKSANETYKCNIDVSGNWFQGWGRDDSNIGLFQYGSESDSTNNTTIRLGANKYGRDFNGQFSSVYAAGTNAGSISVDFSQQEWMDGGTLTLASQHGWPWWNHDFVDHSRYLCAKVNNSCDDDLWDDSKDPVYYCNGQPCDPPTA